jgi:proteasome lid subunit RPN8/RPN11
MYEIEDQFQKIVNEFPEVKTYNNVISHITISLSRGIILEIDYGNFPKKPKVILINQNGEIFKKLDTFIYSLNNWKSKNPKSIMDIIKEVKIFIETSESDTILIKRELMEGILALCREQHPKELVGILKMENNVLTEYIVPPGTYTSTISAIFSLSRLPSDHSYQASVHSHNNGNTSPSDKDKKSTFKRFRCNFIIGFPYTINNVSCYDMNGNHLHFKVVR